ncbi:repair protein Rad1/Rec1/Rad17-domain-containing protein [Peziza echinospora]|nr:repair protein Rad1/Rec1/Rad17-domain-containing protein [Peziza echinospora]
MTSTPHQTQQNTQSQSIHLRPPCLNAVTSSTRQLFTILKCVSFAPRAQVQLSAEGIRVSVEDSRVMQSHAFISKSLFSTYTFHQPPSSDTQLLEDQDPDDPNAVPPPTFTISLTALLECLQLFGADAAARERHTSGYSTSGVASTIHRGGAAAVFDQQVLRIAGTCRLVYIGEGHPLSLILEESGVTTTCHLTTYTPPSLLIDIPILRTSLTLKIIMTSLWLHDAFHDLSFTSTSSSSSNTSSTSSSHNISSSTHLILTASPRPPHLVLSATNGQTSSTIEFARHMMDTFQVPEKVSNTYVFGLVRNAVKAMAVASKVSIRGDGRGVLSLQFMIENTEGGGGGGGGGAGGGSGSGAPSTAAAGVLGNASFIEFRVLPFVNPDDEEDDHEGSGEEGEGGGGRDRDDGDDAVF